MNAVYIDQSLTDEKRRNALYEGELFTYSPGVNTKQFCEFTRELIAEAFHGLDPETAQWKLPVEEYVEILKELKPRFIHHPKSKEFIRSILEYYGCDLHSTYFDVPRLRTSTSDNYLTSGIAYAFHPHRDTWYSAPFQQINWWMPVFEFEQGNGLAFHPKYWATPVANSSNQFAYSEWLINGRKNSATNISKDTREQPKPLEKIEPNPQLRLVCQPGGIILFSAAQLHSSVPNQTGKTRFSIDFRTININDVELGKGAPNIDSACQDLTLGDFLRASDFATLDKEWSKQAVNRNEIEKINAA
jgi:hypothetical protein